MARSGVGVGARGHKKSSSDMIPSAGYNSYHDVRTGRTTSTTSHNGFKMRAHCLVESSLIGQCDSKLN